MLLNFLGKILFPRLAAWQRRKQMKSMIAAILVGLIFAGAVAAAILFQSYRK